MVNYFNIKRRFVEEALSKGDRYIPYNVTKLHSYLARANIYDLIPFNERQGIFEVIAAPYGERMQRGHNKQVVQLDKKECTCGK